ncbi:uncharacterized protein LOC136083057 [Hydra vulgaris]|uniref:Uncharacterized protein LOC136083057 n=1 Tax=Hydra vulgaris TaxID=6087 RepID=A0ABM4CA41_HYDVU
MTKNNFEKLLKIIAVKTVIIAVKTVAEQTMINAANKLQKTSLATTDICVSCDGTWHKRGYSSLNGVFSVISTVSGKVLDVEVMSRYCKGCSINQDLQKSNPNAYAQWKNSHVCKYNYQGSADGMEPEGAKRVFQRSIDNRQLRYIQYLGDGDSKSYVNVKNTYPDKEVEKLECVRHYQKRVGTRLRNLKKREKGLGGKGRLTDATIDRLQNFVGVAIRQNVGNLKEMKAGVLASLFHVASLKNNSLHFPHCPTGLDSWCKYKADKINKTTTYKPGPGLPMDVIMKDRIPKQTFVSLTQLEIGVYDAVAYFNIGAKASFDIFKELNMEPGFHMIAGCKVLNNERKRNAEYRINPDNKSRRQFLRVKKPSEKAHMGYAWIFSICNPCGDYYFVPCGFHMVNPTWIPYGKSHMGYAWVFTICNPYGDYYFVPCGFHMVGCNGSLCFLIIISSKDGNIKRKPQSC